MPDRVAILCSGQGSQHPAMFDLVADCPEAEPVFAAAAGVPGQNHRRFAADLRLWLRCAEMVSFGRGDGP